MFFTLMLVEVKLNGISFNFQFDGNYHGRLTDKALNGLYNNVLLGLIIICNTRNKRVNKNIT